MTRSLRASVHQSFGSDSIELEAAGAAQTWTAPTGAVSVATALSTAGCHDNRATDIAQSIGNSYLASGGQWPAECLGPVAAVIVDHTRRKVLAGIDAAGLHQLYYSVAKGRLTIATRLQDVVSASRADPALNPQALLQYVYFHCIPSPATIYRDVHKLEAGHHLTWNGATLEVQRHFVVTYENTGASNGNLAKELIRELEADVRRALAPARRHGAFLSGGLDSSTVAGLLAKHHHPTVVPTFSIGFEAAGYDEMEFARLASRHFGTDSHEYYVTPDDVCDAVREVVQAFDEPFGNSSALPVYFCARLAHQHGVERMLAGDGGDELFAGNFRYKKQMLFERYSTIPKILRRGLLEPILLRSPIGQLPLANKGASYVRQALVPLPARLQSYNFLHRHEPAEVFAPEMLGTLDLDGPVTQWRAEWDAQPDAHAIDRMLFLDWKFTLHDNDLVKVNTMCRLAGVDVAYPMLDESLIRFSCRVPANLKLRYGELRWFYKHALRHFLPREIIAKKKHGFGLPFGVWLRTHAGLRRVSEQALESLATRGIFRHEFLDETLRLHREDAAGYYGELVWILMALELWLDRHAPRTRF